MTPDELDELDHNNHNAHDDWCLTTASKTHICIWKAYLDYQAQQGALVELEDIPLITPSKFQEFGCRIFPKHCVSGSIPDPAGKHKLLKSTPSENFKKGIKQDPFLFPILKKDTAFDDWKRATIAQANVQDCGNAFDPDCSPVGNDMMELFHLQQVYVCAVFMQSLQTDKECELVCLHAVDSNAQTVFKALVAFHTTATVGSNKMTELLQCITTAHLGDGNWNGPTHGSSSIAENRCGATTGMPNPDKASINPL